MSAHAADGELARPAGKVAATGTVPGDGLDPGTGPRSGDGSDPGAGPNPGTGPGPGAGSGSDPGAGSGPGDGLGAGSGARAASARCLEPDGGSGARAPRSGRVPGGARGQGDVADEASIWAGDVVASLEGVSITYVTRGSARTVVSSYDLVLRAGAVTCLAGRTGCGKTSLLRVVAGLLQPSTGSVTWAGEPVPWRRPERVAAARAGFLGYAGQDSPVLPGLSVLGNILLGCPPGRASRAVRAGLRQRAVDLAEELDLHEVLDQDAATLSGGERQRTAVARALVGAPRLLCLDEPTAALDEETARHLVALLRAQATRGAAVLVTSHDPLVLEVANELHHLTPRPAVPGPSPTAPT